MSSTLSKMPNIAIPRSRFKQPFNHSTSFFHGKLIPIDCFEVIPGDNYSLTLSSLIRMSTPIAPIMGNIECYLHAFFVPMRLIWDDAEKFYGDPSNHGKVSSITPVNPTSVVIPTWKTSTSPSLVANIFPTTIVSYLGKPFLKHTSPAEDSGISQLKERGYYLIWNEYFRPSNLIKPFIINKSSGTSELVCSTDYQGVPIGYFGQPVSVCKKYDYFTSATLSPQFGDSVTLPLGTFAPVITRDAVANGRSAITDPIAGTFPLLWNDSQGMLLDYAEDSGEKKWILNVGANRSDTYKGKTIAGSSSGVNVDGTFFPTAPRNLWADLSTATGATINSIRYAFQVQKYLERSNYGSHFFEILNAHYGTTSPDGRLQRPDRLGYHKFYINVSQVLATASSTDGSNSSQLGQTGAVSVTGDKVHLFDAAFTEPGYVYVLLDTKFDRSYSGGILREDLRSSRFEFYSPEFANLGDQAILKKEIALYSNFNSGTKYTNEIFGYQEHWAEYRYRKDRVSGLLNPTSTAQAGVSNLAFWTLSDVFDSVDSTSTSIALTPSFLFEDRKALSRALVTGDSGPDYIADFHFDYLATRELPLYSIPGLIDHFGAL